MVRLSAGVDAVTMDEYSENFLVQKNYIFQLLLTSYAA
jgi:hypothetical protein